MVRLGPFVRLPRNIYGEYISQENAMRLQKRAKLSLKNRILMVLKDNIKWPSPAERQRLHRTFAGFPYYIGAVDSTVHRRNRPGHRQSAFSRKDVDYHFTSSQATVAADSSFLDFETGFEGHQQDQGNWRRSSLKITSISQIISSSSFLRLIIPL